jgi:hypothetical protein
MERIAMSQEEHDFGLTFASEQGVQQQTPGCCCTPDPRASSMRYDVDIMMSGAWWRAI